MLAWNQLAGTSGEEEARRGEAAKQGDGGMARQGREWQGCYCKAMDEARRQGWTREMREEKARQGKERQGKAEAGSSVLVVLLVHFLHDKVRLAGRDAGSLLVCLPACPPLPPPLPPPPFPSPPPPLPPPTPSL